MFLIILKKLNFINLNINVILKILKFLTILPFGFVDEGALVLNN